MKSLSFHGHLDHLGLENNKVHFGADDNGYGSMAILEIAQAFKAAEKAGHSPKRSLLFLHLTAEEIGLQGSRYYVQNPVYPLNKTMANLNIDMIGRVDKAHKKKPNYIYIIGADRISKELHFISEKINNTFSNLELDYKYNDENDRNNYYYRSDHYHFAKNNIPVIFYFNGEHNDYHKTTDTPDKINYDLLTKRTKLIFATAWQLANKETFLIHNNAL
ncbi:M28 family peptidase [Lacinutrix neustonica]|uniref:M28 family peptidase n=1 Tax=Lacinutrix neustonica TaxID=2980107 RepID=UPI0028BE960F|nr:M28 family peptidase [Lacinutrix neustonica]